MKWYAGSDHAGRALKDRLVAALRARGDEVVDRGCHDDGSVDYPDYAGAVARDVAAEDGARGLLVCGTGIGMAMAANKVSGVRAAVVTDAFTARASREHNDANVIALGERVTGPGVAEDALDAFRSATYAGGRHDRRVAKIKDLESG